MGYAKEKQSAERKWKRVKIIALAIALFLLAGLVVLASLVPAGSWKYYFALPKAGERADGEMRVHFIDVGQGDSTIVELPDGKIMLIDGGSASTGSTNAVMRYLNALDIRSIDYLVVTHADEDHCGGLDEVVKYKNIKRAYLPTVEPTENTEYAELYAALKKQGVDCVASSRNIRLDGAGAYPYTLSFLYPYSYQSESLDGENEDSAVIWLDYKGVSALFTGDAPFATEEILMRDDSLSDAFTARGVSLQSTEILKVAHHGSDSATSRRFVEYLGVKTAVISCGEDNAYGHPAQGVCTALQDREIYRTDRDGSVCVTVKEDGAYGVKTLGK